MRHQAGTRLPEVAFRRCCRIASTPFVTPQLEVEFWLGWVSLSSGGLTDERQHTTTLYPGTESPSGQAAFEREGACFRVGRGIGRSASQIYAWVTLVLAQAEKAFEKSSHNGRERTEKAKDQRIEQLLPKITQKNEVIAELMEANVLNAIPGAKTGRRIALGCAIRPVRTTFRDWPESEKPSRQDAAKSSTGGLLSFTNANSPQFHFPLNQHKEINPQQNRGRAKSFAGSSLHRSSFEVGSWGNVIHDLCFQLAL